MSAGEPAVLTGRLLFRKGGASPAGFAPTSRQAAEDGVIDFARKRRTPADPAAAVRLSFKLDRARHQSLRIAAAKLGLGNGALLTAALDHYLRTAVPTALADSCACLERVFAPSERE